MKRAVSVFLSIIILLGFCFVPIRSAETKVSAATGFTAWSGYSSYLKGAGTETNPFLISKPGDLAYFRKSVATDGGTITYYSGNDTSTAALTKTASTAYYKLTEDIYYNDPNGDEWKNWSATVTPANNGGTVHTWSPPGLNDNTKAIFDGSFDGGGHTIYGLYIVHTDDNCVGFLGLAKKATIENLTLAYGYVKGRNCVSAFVGRAMMGTNIINCTSRMRVTGSYAVGGFVGGNPKTGAEPEQAIDTSAETYGPNFTVYGCTNRNAVYGAKWVGGIAGLITGGYSRVSIDSCKNTGKITATTAASGGILGGTMTVDDLGHNFVYGCTNSGNVLGGTESFAGGIVGCGRATDIMRCLNTGEITASSTKYVGGITGGNATPDKLANSRINFCTNKGAVNGATYTGGIIGIGVSTSLRKSANMGAVTGTNAVGGIAGKACGETDVRDSAVCDCINTGAVSSSNGGAKVAGIVGLAYVTGTVSDNIQTTIRRCVNYAAVSTGRAICYTDSTLKDDNGKIYLYTVNAASCFGMSGTNTLFDGGTKVTSFVSSSVLNELNSLNAGTWMYGYPVPVLTELDYDMQGDAEAGSLLAAPSAAASSAPGITLSSSVSTSSSYYGSISSLSPVYGFAAVRADSVEEDREITVGKSGVQTVTGTLSGAVATGSFDTLPQSGYNVVYKFRPFVKLTVNGIAVYVYGKCKAASYYTSSGAASVAAVNGTAVTTCENSVYVLTGGTHLIEYTVDSASPAYSVAFSSSDDTVATVSNGKVKGIKAGIATVTVKIVGVWGTRRHTVNVTVLDDVSSTVYANDYAASDNTLRYHTNELTYIKNTVAKNDGYCLSYNGTVFLIDGGHKNTKSLEYLKSLREKYLSDGLASGRLSTNDYYRYLLSDKCRLKIVNLWTHWHNDHLSAMRY
ncbi:MAG: hypothetical protein IJS94_07145, partial [Clostridia bacterium]|nr:hypothetical protein [Clostridia bacterium]